ncbi:organic cation transporter protein [Neocloeon triangulifer]|uniref:organic cation transporter protein n=1 Tax=Neocloeon triangulifer TaxID=2078957 RepID=UPI00286F2457|nr:organic cation transporter protein [Neocloeon triangulifer]
MDSDLDNLMGHLGEFGRYQMRQFLLHILAGGTAGLHMLTLVTVAAVPDHRCLLENLESSLNATYDNPDASDFIPTDSGALDSCHYLNSDNASVPCNAWVFDKQYHASSRAIEWNMVCDNRWMAAVAQSAYMFGVFTGAVVLGSLADKYGRKTIFCISAVLQLIFGVGVAFCPDFYSFLVVRFIYGIFGSAGAYITGFVLTMELVGPSKRTICGISFQAAFATGVMLVAAWGALISDRLLLQVIYGLHSLLLIPHYWLMDESPRWLWAQGRIHEAVCIVERATKINGQPTPDTAFFVSRGISGQRTKEETADGSGSAGLIDLVRTPSLRAKTLNCCLNWFANSLVYYGLSLNTGKLLGNPFLMLFIVGLVEWPSYIATVLLMDRTGRRSLISSLMLLGGFACLLALYIPEGMLVTVIVMLGKFFIAGSFAIIYNYTAELFPTVVRNTALGVGSMCARLSGALTPLIGLLDSFDKTLPTFIFASLALISGALALLLPETLGKPMPQTLEEGEQFGKGDTACSSCFGRKRTASLAEPEPSSPSIALNTVD